LFFLSKHENAPPFSIQPIDHLLHQCVLFRMDVVFCRVGWTVFFALTIPLARQRWAAQLVPLSPIASAWQLHCLSCTTSLGSNAAVRIVTAFSPGSTLLMSGNYETTVVFLMVVIQMISASIFFSFGHEYRQAWYRNITFVVLAVAYSFPHIYVTLVPGLVSCLFRINCDNDPVVRGLWTSALIPTGVFQIRFMHLLQLR
jgi:hypothetical protein